MLGTFGGGNVGFGVMLHAKDAFSTEFAKFRKEMSMTTMATLKFTRNMQKSGAALAALGGVGFGIAKLGGVFKEMSDVAGKYEQIEIAIKSIAGSEARGQKLIDQLKEYTLQSPLGFEQLIDQTKRMLAYGVPLENIIDDVKMLTEISAGVGLDKFQFLALAYGQTSSMGRLMGQEVLQFANAGVGIQKQVAKLRGTSFDKLKADINAKKTVVSAKEVREALQSMVNEGGMFHGLIEKQMKTFEGLSSILRDAFYFLQVEMGKVINERYLGILQKMVALASRLVTFLSSDKGKASLKTFLKFFEVFAIGTLVAATFIGIKFLLYLTGFLLPLARKQTFMLALGNNRLGTALGVVFKSMFAGFGGIFRIIGAFTRFLTILFFVHSAMQSIFGADYIQRFIRIFTAFLELVNNYDAVSDTSEFSAKTVYSFGDSNNPNDIHTSYKLFQIYLQIRGVITGIVQGMLFIVEIALNIVLFLAKGVEMLLKFLGIIKENKGLTAVDVINQDLLVNIGRFVGVILGIRFVFRMIMQVVRGFRMLRDIIRSMRSGHSIFTRMSRSISSMRWRTRRMYRTMRDWGKNVGTAIRGGVRGFRNMVTNLRSFTRGMRGAIVSSRIFSFVTNRGLRMINKKVIMMIALVVLLIAAIMALFKTDALKNMGESISSWYGSTRFGNSWIGEGLGWATGKTVSGIGWLADWFKPEGAPAETGEGVVNKDVSPLGTENKDGSFTPKGTPPKEEGEGGAIPMMPKINYDDGGSSSSTSKSGGKGSKETSSIGDIYIDGYKVGEYLKKRQEMMG